MTGLHDLFEEDMRHTFDSTRDVTVTVTVVTNEHSATVSLSSRPTQPFYFQGP